MEEEVIFLNVFVCVDENLGISFNNRRQSRDAEVASKVIEMSNGGKLYMNEYSSKLFKNYSNILVDNDYLNIAEEGDCCFVELNSLGDYNDKIDTVTLFKWNKVYPSDMKLDIIFSDRKLEKVFCFKGTSHDKITCEVWTR